MKQTTKMSRAVSQLEHMFNSINTDFFNGELPQVIITVQSKPGTYGHSSRAKVWKRKEDDLYEINIAAEVLSLPIEETIDTICHESIHLYCRVNGIQETSNNGYYHNKIFKQLAEEHGLTCVYTGSRYGWNTVPGENLIAYAIEKGWNEIQISCNTIQPIKISAAGSTGAGKEPGERTSSTRKLICTGCKQTVRATKKVNILCGDCMLPMIEVL